MKNQYFGDINDYKKYGLLRILSDDDSLKTSICWMLTESDGRTDGIFINYLRQPEKWSRYDPELYTSLHRNVLKNNQRDINICEKYNLIPSARYYSKIISENANEREKYFSDFYKSIHGANLVFFDPDNGIEVKSVKYGKRYSNKYLYWQELLHTYSLGKSILLYQHFPRIKRDMFIHNLSKDLCNRTGASCAITFETSRVIFFLIPQKDYAKFFKEKSLVVQNIWKNEIKVGFYIREIKY